MPSGWQSDRPDAGAEEKQDDTSEGYAGPSEIWAYNFLSTKHFHGVSSGHQHSDVLTSRYGKISCLKPLAIWPYQGIIAREARLDCEE